MTKTPKVKLHPKFKSLFKKGKRYHIISGGRGSGKSYSVALYLLMLTMEEKNVILFSRYTMSSVAISVYPEFLEKIELLGLESMFNITANEIINTVTGSKIIFKGLKPGSGIQTANLKSIANLNIVCIDEAEEIPSEDIFETIDLSVRQKDKVNKLILVFNPTTKASWIYERFFESQGVPAGECRETEDTNYIHSTYLDNIQYLDETFINQVKKIEESNPEKFLHKIMGAFLDVAEGVIFKNWRIGEFDNSLEYGFGMDFGYSDDPTTLVNVAIDKKNMKIYLEELLYKPGLTTPEILSEIREHVGSKEVIADNSEGRLIEELKRAGINIKACVKGAGSVAEGIKLMTDYELIITPASVNAHREANNYVWSNKKAGDPKDMYNHFWDAARYRITHKLKAATGVYYL